MRHAHGYLTNFDPFCSILEEPVLFCCCKLSHYTFCTTPKLCFELPVDISNVCTRIPTPP